MKVASFVGGREVVASGTLVLSGGDLVANVFIEDINYAFIFSHSAAPPTISRSNPDTKTLTITISGVHNTPCQWAVPFVGTINGKRIDLAFIVTWFAALPERPTSAMIDYTFSAAPNIAGLLE